MNIRPDVTINGINSKSITGLLITELAPITKSKVRTLIEEVDGRDGDIITPLGFSAYDKPVKIALTTGYNIDEVISFFNSEGIVIFSNEPDKYYRFAIYEQIDFERLIRYKTGEVTFHVQPFKFSAIERETEFSISGSPETVSIYNAGNYFSKPTITITGQGNVTLSINGTQLLTIELGETTQTIIINVEEMNAYGVDNTLLNRLVAGNYDNIKLKVGTNTITTSGNVTDLKIDKFSRWL